MAVHKIVRFYLEFMFSLQLDSWRVTFPVSVFVALWFCSAASSVSSVLQCFGTSNRAELSKNPLQPPLFLFQISPAALCSLLTVNIIADPTKENTTFPSWLVMSLIYVLNINITQRLQFCSRVQHLWRNVDTFYPHLFSKKIPSWIFAEAVNLYCTHNAPVDTDLKRTEYAKVTRWDLRPHAVVVGVFVAE